MFRHVFLFGSLLATFITVSDGILCYSCISQGGSGEECITDPQNVPNSIAKCSDDRYCTIRRLEYASDPGVIYSFLRGCDEKDGLLENGQHPSEDTVVWFQSCNFADLCNIGDGLMELTPENVANGGGSNSGNIIIIPASKASSLSKRFVFLITLFATLTHLWQ